MAPTLMQNSIISKAKILVVDDEASNVRLLERILEMFGCTKCPEHSGFAPGCAAVPRAGAGPRAARSSHAASGRIRDHGAIEGFPFSRGVPSDSRPDGRCDFGDEAARAGFRGEGSGDEAARPFGGGLAHQESAREPVSASRTAKAEWPFGAAGTRADEPGGGDAFPTARDAGAHREAGALARARDDGRRHRARFQ